MSNAATLTPPTTLTYLRPGLRSVMPYLVVQQTAACIDFLTQAFHATERLRIPGPDNSITHAELALGNGAIELSTGCVLYRPAPAAIHLYVDDPDATHHLALTLGATELYPVADQPWGDRQGAVKDPFGNHWYIAHANWALGSGGMTFVPTVQPFLHIEDAPSLLAFAESVFAAESLGTAWSPTKTILHATLRIGDSTFELAEATPDFPPLAASLHIYVPDVDATYTQALADGAQSLESPRTEPYGDRLAAIRDPWGITWFITTHLTTP